MSQSEEITMPAWAKVVGGAIFVIAIIGMLYVMDIVTEGSPDPPGGNAPPAVDPALLVGSWGFRHSDEDGITIVVDAGGMCLVGMHVFDSTGTPVCREEISGTWRVSGANFIIVPSDGGPPVVREIMVANGQQLALRNPATGLVNPFVRLE